MLQLKKWGQVTLAFVLLCSLLPWSVLPTAEANDENYFEFDDALLNRSTSANPFIHNQASIDLEGILIEVQSSGVQVKVEHIYRDTEEPVDGSSYTREVVATSDNRFEILGLALFEGLNKLTFSGISRGVQVESAFYILYNSAPYLVDLNIQTNTDDAAPLNAGAGTVVTSAEAFLEGLAPNATEVIVNDDYVVQPLPDGSFFTPIIMLTPGKNTIKLDIKRNDSDAFTIERTVFYYNREQLIFEGALYFDYDGNGTIDSGEREDAFDVINTEQRTFAVEFLTPPELLTGGFVGKIMVPAYEIALDDTDIVVYVDGVDTQASNITLSNPVPVRYGTNNDISFRIYDLSFDIAVETDTSKPLDHLITVETTYYEVEGEDEIRFKFADRNLNIVEDVVWLYDYANDPEAAKPLQGAQINSSTIYIKVTKNKEYDTAADELIVYLSPYLNNDLTVTYEGLADPEYSAIYRIDNIPPGSHVMFINFADSLTDYDYRAPIEYVSGASAVFLNLFDGMTIRGNQPVEVELLIRNVDPNFNPASSGAQFLVNNQPVPNAFDDYVFGQPLSFTVPSSLLWNAENRLKVILTHDGFTTTKEIKIYIVEGNLPMIDIIKPVVPADPANRPGLSSESDRRLLYEDMYGLTLHNGDYYTNATMYDLVMEVSNYERFYLQYDGENIISYDRSVDSSFPNFTTASPDKSWVNNKMIQTYEYGNKLVVRVRDLGFPAPGPQAFNLITESSNRTRATVPVVIVREEVPYQVRSPRPTTSDDKIIVNKNFVNVIIEAENADAVIIEKVQAVKNEAICEDCFEHEFTGLRENRWNTIDFTVVRGEDEIKGKVEVYYANSLAVGAQFKTELNRRMRVFNNAIQLQFDRGTLLQTPDKDPLTHQITTPTFYEDQRILFGIADPETGMVEKVTDDGITKSVRGTLPGYFRNFEDDFTFISPVYWIHGGLAEVGAPGTPQHRPRTDGLAPYGLDSSQSFTHPQRANRELVPSTRGTLTLKYDDIVREAAGTRVTVFHFNQNGVWRNIGGQINTRNHEITVPFTEFGFYVVATLRYPAQDIRTHRWASEVLTAIYSKGFMNKIRPPMEFGVNDYVTRGEYAQLLVKALQLELNADSRNTFIDVPYNYRTQTWSYEYIETAARAGIIQGLQDRVFGPNQTLTREQAAVMIARALELKLAINDAKLEKKLRDEFVDVDQMHYYAMPSILAVFNSGIMLGEATVTTGGDNMRFNPKAIMTRAEAAAIAVRVMQSELDYFPSNLN